MPRFKKICICSEFPPPYGGIGLQAKLLAESLESEGYIVLKISTNLPDTRSLNLVNRLIIIRSIVRFICFVIKCFINFPGNDIIHILSGSYLNFFLYTCPAVLIGKIYNTPVIIHYHGGAAREFLINWFCLARPAFQVADALVVPSGFLKDIFCGFGLSATIIPNIIGFDSIKFKDRITFYPKFLITRHIEPIYNISCAIRAFSMILNKYPGAILQIAGNGSEEHVIKKLAKELNCFNAINFLGIVPHDQILKLYEENDILLNTSNVDNLPLSILEGFSSGLLVISTKAGGIPYIIQHMENGLLANLNDHEEIANLSLWSLENQILTKEMVKNARENITIYSWESIHPQIESLYKQVTHPIL